MLSADTETLDYFQTLHGSFHEAAFDLQLGGAGQRTYSTAENKSKNPAFFVLTISVLISSQSNWTRPRHVYSPRNARTVHSNLAGALAYTRLPS